VIHSRVGPWPYSQTLDLAGKACQGTNTLAYYENQSITAVKSFIGFTLVCLSLSMLKLNIDFSESGNPYWRGGLSTIGLLIKIGCFVKEKNLV
jgi:hypothetical protein